MGASSGFTLEPIDFKDIPGWAEDDHRAALAAFRRGASVLDSHPPKERAAGVDPAALTAAIARGGALGDVDGTAARAFFEAEFRPMEVHPESGGGFFTAYYEPVVAGSRTGSAAFPVPIYARPDDLVEIDPDDPPAGIEAGTRFARKLAGGFAPYPDRAAIEAGFLKGRGLELVYLADPVDAFYIHIQGAARIRLAEGGDMRITYAAKSGHPYTPIGRVLIERGALPPGGATMETIRGWLAAHPDEAAGVMAENRSFIFFREAPVDDPALGPVAAAKVPLTPGRSLAVDRLIHSFHGPVWIDTALADGKPFRRLMVAQDTGSAIVGAARGDIFTGSGDEAGAVAGGLASKGRFILLVPRTGVEGGAA
ncbi:MAG: MltA domain-containing protein [Bauldia sp.]|nr:MltA domain-containing protein [Bauldia sp.]